MGCIDFVRISLILFLSHIPQSQSSFYKTSIAPIELHLQRVQLQTIRNATTNQITSILTKPIDEPCRTKPEFFERFLGLQPNRHFEFALDRWHQLKHSKLFSNLTAKSIVRNDAVSLLISGQELPSISISPEVSATASLTRPEMTGGLTFEDRNFRGLGQKFLFIFGKKEGIEVGTEDLEPVIRMEWSDCSLPTTNKLSIAYEQDESLQDTIDIIPLFQRPSFNPQTEEDQNKFNLWKKNAKIRMEYLSRAITLNWSGAIPFRRKSPPITDSFDPSVPSPPPIHRWLSFGFEPYFAHKTARYKKEAAGAYTTQGIRSSVFMNGQRGGSVRVSLDEGFSRENGVRHNFRLLGYKVLLQDLVSKIKMKLPLIFSTDGKATEVKLPVRLSTAFKVSSVVGSGAVPLLHMSKLGGNKLIRGRRDGFAPSSSSKEKGTSLLLDERVRKYAVLQGDLYFGNHVGAFVDTGLFLLPRIPQETMECSSSVGISLKGAGLRCDVAWDMDDISARPRIHLGLDSFAGRREISD